jgi:hypothetical protein
MAKDKAASTTKLAYECNPFSLQDNGKALGSSSDTVNSFSIRKSGKKPA